MSAPGVCGHGQGYVQVQVKPESFRDVIGYLNPEPSEEITFVWDTIRPWVVSFTTNRTIQVYLDKPLLASTEFRVVFDEVSGPAEPPVPVLRRS